MSPRTGSAPAAARAAADAVRPRQGAHRPPGGHQAVEHRAAHEAVAARDEHRCAHAADAPRDERPHGRRVLELEGAAARAPAALRVEGPHRLLDQRHPAGRHAQLVDARGPPAGASPRGRSPPRRRRRPGRRARAAASVTRGDQPQHGRVDRVGEAGHAGVAALGGHRVLHQVVGADRQEVRPAAPAPTRPARPPGPRSSRPPPPRPPPARRRRGTRAPPPASASAWRSSPASLTIGNMIDSGRLGRRLEGGAQLGQEQLGPRQRQPQPADAEERVVLGRLAEVGQRLVGAGVEGAQHQAPAAEGGGGLRRRRRAARPRPAPSPGPGRGTPCGRARRRRPPRRRPARRRRAPRRWRRPRRRRPSRVDAGSPDRSRAAAARRSASSRRAACAAAASASGATTTAPASPSSSRGVPSATARIAGPEAGDRRDAERPRDDRGVRGRPAAGARHAGDPPGVERRGVRRPDLLGHQHGGRAVAAALVGAGARQPPQHAPADVDAGRSPARAGTRRRAPRRRGPRPAPRRPTRAPPGRPRRWRPRRPDQVLVAEQQELRVEDVRRLPPRALGGRRAQVAQVGLDGGARRGERGPLLLGRAGRGVGQGRRAAAGEARRAGRQPGGRRDPGQLGAGRGSGSGGRRPGGGLGGRGGGPGRRRPVVLGHQGGDGLEGLRGGRARGRGCARCAPAARRGPTAPSGCGRRPGPRPVVTFSRRTSASRPAAARTTAAAGRACRPCSPPTTAVVASHSAAAVVGRGPGAGRRRRRRRRGGPPCRPARRAPPRPPRRARRPRGPPPPRPPRPRPGAPPQPHPAARLVVEEVEGGLGAQHGRAQVHQHQRAAVGRLAHLDRGHHAHGVGAERLAGLVEPAGGLDRHLVARPSPGRAPRRPRPAGRCGRRRRSRPPPAPPRSAEPVGPVQHLHRVHRRRRRWRGRSASGRSRSRTPPSSAPESRTCSKRGARRPSRSSYFSRFSP